MAELVAVDGTTIYYEDSGDPDGRAVVLVHGITESSASWGPVRERLAADHRVITVDLRGHGASGTADRYDLEAMAGDVVAVLTATDPDAHLVGHSLGGAVVSTVGAATPVTSVVNVDQPLRLGALRGDLVAAAPALRDPESFPTVMAGLFDQLAGPLAGDARAALEQGRRPDQDVVLGVWSLLLDNTEAEVDAAVDAALSGYAGGSVPYLTLCGIDPGPDYSDWLAARIPGASVEVWADQGHYPHLVDPDRFVARLQAFWAE